ncbi:MAG: nucleotidyltransferase family protein, partial [Candidatus Omnitrophica bacterium]|nr:nucleotidyltransferase family protein [Candidatus Omnitrophota bacterium]
MIIEEKSRQAKEKAEQIAKSLHLPLLKKGDPVYLNTSSSSMYPFVKGGDTIKVAPVKETDIKIGDIIAVDNEDKDKAWFYAHRVVRKFKDNGSNFFVTKGDASREGMDEPVGFSKIAGRVINIKRNGLKIDLESPFWKRLNRYIAKASLRYPNALRNLAPWISLAIEWRRFFSKLGRRIDEPLSNTEELILICARTNIDKGLINRAKELITRGLDWDLFSEASVKSGLPIIFYNCLEKIGYPAAVPAELMDKLKISYLSAIPRINFQYEEAKRLLRLFFEKDLPAVPLKGSFLSKRIYGDIAARGLSADFDLLVEENSLE